MIYQALKALKTKSKLLGKFATLREAHDCIKASGGVFTGFTYIGGFPAYIDGNNNHYNIQGQHEGFGIVLSLNKDELSAFNFTN